MYEAGDGASNGEAASEITIVHTSDLHLGADHRRDQLSSLDLVARAAEHLQADVLILAGDIFDHNRLPLAAIDAAARRLGDLSLQVVILPGNHDCLTEGSVYRRGGITQVPNVAVLGLIDADSLLLERLDLEIWGRPHLDHIDMSPLAAPHRPRRLTHHLSVAHGHWVTGPHDHHRSWLIRDDEIDALDTDYLALGHWDRALSIGRGRVPAYYSGSPDLARSVNVIRISPRGVEVQRHTLAAHG